MYFNAEAVKALLVTVSVSFSLNFKRYLTHQNCNYFFTIYLSIDIFYFEYIDIFMLLLLLYHILF